MGRHGVIWRLLLFANNINRCYGNLYDLREVEQTKWKSAVSQPAADNQFGICSVNPLGIVWEKSLPRCIYRSDKWKAELSAVCMP